MCAISLCTSLRFLSLRNNPFEHNLSGPDRWLYYQMLPRSQLLNFPFDERVPMDKWDSDYKKLTPVLCYHQASYLLDLVKKKKSVPIALWPRLLQHLGRLGAPPSPTHSQKHEPFFGFGDIFRSGGFLASNSESTEVDRAHVLFTLVRHDMMNSQVIGNGDGSQSVVGQVQHEEIAVDSFQVVIGEIEQHSISRVHEAKEQQELDEAIAHNDFNESVDNW